MHNDLGIYKNIRIEGYESKGGEGKLMRLVHHDEIKRRMEVDEQAIQLFQRYASYDIAFLCVLGEKGNGKSFILDKLLNLAGVTGNHVPAVLLSFLSTGMTDCSYGHNPFAREIYECFCSIAGGSILKAYPLSMPNSPAFSCFSVAQCCSITAPRQSPTTSKPFNRWFIIPTRMPRSTERSCRRRMELCPTPCTTCIELVH